MSYSLYVNVLSCASGTFVVVKLKLKTAQLAALMSTCYLTGKSLASHIITGLMGDGNELRTTEHH